MNLRHIILALFIALTALCQKSMAMRSDSLLLERMFNYSSAISKKRTINKKTYNYNRLVIDVDKRNFTLLAIPTMYAIAKSVNRKFIDESFKQVSNYGTDSVSLQTLIRTTTIPHRSSVMENMQKYLTPKIYHETIIDNYIISPFARINRRLYRYKTDICHQDTAIVTFKPLRKNTQLVNGWAAIDYYTGRIIECEINGEYDMIDFTLSLTMGDEYRLSLLPTKLTLSSRFSFLGNKINSKYVSYYDVDIPIKDSTNVSLAEYMKSIRPDTLLHSEQTVIDNYINSKAINDTTNQKKRSKLWEMIGNHTLNRIKSHFGANDKGYVRVNPLLNPLYLEYSQRRGITYKTDIRASYMFTPKSEISARFNAGYSFKQKKLYTRIPLTWYFNKYINGFIRAEMGNGNHVGNSLLMEHLAATYPEMIEEFQRNNLNDFSNHFQNFDINIDVTPNVTLNGGIKLHQRKATNIKLYKIIGQSYEYHSSAPKLEIQLRPWATKGPIISADYERGIKGFLKSNIDYERWEFNTEYIYKQNKLQNLHLRFGTGFYTSKDKNGYFLDYENFRDNTLTGGWNDDWTGEFELLKSEIYNQSDYYIRANISYESPLLLCSRIPLAGKYIEMERIHVSTLDVKDIHPYIEAGYGFTTRWFSFGFFASTRQWKFDTIGIKWGLELFRKW